MTMYIFFGEGYVRVNNVTSITAGFVLFQKKYNWFILFLTSAPVKEHLKYGQFKRLLDDGKITEYIEYGKYNHG